MFRATLRPTLLFSALALALLMGAAPDPSESGGRYQMTPARAARSCASIRKPGQPRSAAARMTGGRARPSADDRRALETEIDRLSTENTELKSAVKRLEELLKLPDADAPSPKRGGIQIAGCPPSKRSIGPWTTSRASWASSKSGGSGTRSAAARNTASAGSVATAGTTGTILRDYRDYRGRRDY